jgi:amidase
MVNDVAFESAGQLATRIRRRELGSRELLELYLARVEKHNPALNAIVTLDAERARARATQADDAAKRGEWWGPLHGLPITIKDTLETAGLRTTAGYPPLAEHVPATDAAAVERCLTAGAVIFGKTNTPVLAGDWQSYNPVFGTTNNPWDLTRTPGGSSGGSAAALAAGLTAFEIGSDIAGSIRMPAHWCGVYGHKPTHGIVPVRGHIPGPPGCLAQADLSVVGPLARSAADLDLLLGVVAGPLPGHAVGWRLALPPPRHSVIREFRVGAWLDDPDFPVDGEVRQALEGAVEALRRSGVRVDDAARPALGLSDAVRVYEALLWPILLAGGPPEVFERLTAHAATHPDDPSPLGRMARHGTSRHRDWIIANEFREQLRAKLAVFFREYDVLLMPVNQVPAIRHDHTEPMTERVIHVNGRRLSYYDLLGWISLATLSHHPATSAPVGCTREGLPVGVQILGPYLEDRTSIGFAAQMAPILEERGLVSALRKP